MDYIVLENYSSEKEVILYEEINSNTQKYRVISFYISAINID